MDEGQLIPPQDIERVMESLTVLDVDVRDLGRDIDVGRGIKGFDAGVCIIDITCCIIDCSCHVSEMEKYENPANRLGGFMFRLPEDRENAYAPVYFVPEMRAPDALRIGHDNLRYPRGNVDASVMGLAGEVMGGDALEKFGIAASAPVIALKPREEVAQDA